MLICNLIGEVPPLEGFREVVFFHFKSHKMVDCCTRKSKAIKTEFSYTFFQSIEDCRNEWVLATHPENVFLQFPYLHLLEKNPLQQTDFVYVIISEGHKNIGVSYFQHKIFEPGKSLNYNKNDWKIWRSIKSFVANRLIFTTLISGNLLLTGEYGFYVAPEYEAKADAIYNASIDFAIEKLKAKDIHISLLFVKDLYTQHLDFERLSNSVRFTFQPNMVMDLRSEWKSKDDYLNDLTSKYRIRAKRAFKKGDEFAKVELDLDQIELHKTRIFELYKIIAEKAGFNLFYLNENYIVSLKKELGDDFTFLAYFLDNQLVGFCTTIQNYHELEAHCIGFEHQYNPSHQIYLNLLFDMIEKGIESRSKKIIFARTAMEIKGSVGAIGYDMFCYIRHKNPIVNYLLPRIIGFLDTNETWEQRSPFGKN